MNIMVINATEQKGSAFQLKELFLQAMGKGHSITEFALPRDFPAFCLDCKVCACQSLNDCPHSRYTAPLWEHILASDLLVFTLPSYASDIPQQVQALLDHYYAKFMAHVPEANMSKKQAVIVTREAGLMTSKNTRLMKETLEEWGLGRTHIIKQKQPSFNISWHYLLGKESGSFQMQCERIASKIKKKADAHSSLSS